MKAIEAIGLLRKQSADTVEAMSMATSALEKQIPQKVHKHHANHKGVCPNCLMVEDTSANFCRACGQALDWGDLT